MLKFLDGGGNREHQKKTGDKSKNKREGNRWCRWQRNRRAGGRSHGSAGLARRVHSHHCLAHHASTHGHDVVGFEEFQVGSGMRPRLGQVFSSSSLSMSVQQLHVSSSSASLTRRSIPRTMRQSSSYRTGQIGNFKFRFVSSSFMGFILFYERLIVI